MKKYFLYILALVLTLAFFLFKSPYVWGNVEVGMSHSEVSDLLGNPDFDMRGIKGYDLWVRSGVVCSYELFVYYDKEATVVEVHLKRKYF